MGIAKSSSFFGKQVLSVGFVIILPFVSADTVPGILEIGYPLIAANIILGKINSPSDKQIPSKFPVFKNLYVKFLALTPPAKIFISLFFSLIASAVFKAILVWGVKFELIATKL